MIISGVRGKRWQEFIGYKFKKVKLTQGIAQQ
jgi:hypothetical protein